jgi:glycosyltransferase involved in cell wall biosynthesis
LYLADCLLPPGGIQKLSATCIQILRDLEDEGRLKYDCVVRRGAIPHGLCCRTAHDSGIAMQAQVACDWILRRANLIFSDHLHTARFPSRVKAKHIFWAHLIEFDPPLPPMHRRSMESAHQILCDSSFTLRYLSTLYPEIQPKLRVLYLGDSPRARLDSALYERNFQKQHLTMIGRMAPEERYKGHDQVIEALPNVLGMYPSCEMTIIGRGADRERLQKKARELRLDSHLQFLSNLEDERIFEVIKSSCGILLPSLREAFGLVYLYAMWAGIPAVAVRGTVGEEVLGDCGVYADSQTPEAIGSAMIEVLSGRWTFGNESQRRYKTDFSYNSFKERLSKFVLNEAVQSA